MIQFDMIRLNVWTFYVERKFYNSYKIRHRGLWILFRLHRPISLPGCYSKRKNNSVLTVHLVFQSSNWCFLFKNNWKGTTKLIDLFRKFRSIKSICWCQDSVFYHIPVRWKAIPQLKEYKDSWNLFNKCRPR